MLKGLTYINYSEFQKSPQSLAITLSNLNRFYFHTPNVCRYSMKTNEIHRVLSIIHENNESSVESQHSAVKYLDKCFNRCRLYNTTTSPYLFHIYLSKSSKRPLSLWHKQTISKKMLLPLAYGCVDDALVDSFPDCVIQEAQLPQRNSASASHVYLGWLTDRAMHRTPQNRRGCTISYIQTLWFKKCWPKTHFVMK